VTSASLPDPPPVAGAPRAPVHPLATTAIIISCSGFAVPVVAGLVGALLGALALQRIATGGGRWRGVERARIALGLGLLTGAVPLGVVLLVQRDDWGVAPIVALLLYAAMVAAIGASARAGSARPASGTAVGRIAGGAALGAGGVVIAAAVLIGLVFAVIFLFQSTITGIASAIGDAACK
jgi:hypothetical protein